MEDLKAIDHDGVGSIESISNDDNVFGDYTIYTGNNDVERDINDPSWREY